MILSSRFRQAFRALRRNPAFTIAVVITLAVGIAGNTAVFTLTDAVLLRPLPYSRPNELVLLDATRKIERTSNGFTLARYDLLRERARSLAAVAVATTDTLNLTGAGDPQQVAVGRVSGNFFGMLGVGPALGRLFTDADARPESTPVAAISDALWRKTFGSDPRVVGRTIGLGGTPFTIVGILPPHATFPYVGVVDLWIPRYFELSLFTPERLRMGVGYLTAVARLAPGVSIGSARAEMGVIDRRYAVANPTAPDAAGIETTVEPLHDASVANVRSRLVLLSAAVALVLLIACANAANLLLSRALVRSREIATRVALGATRPAIVSQLLTESVLLATAAGAIGLALAFAVLRAAARLYPEPFGRVVLSVDGRVILFTVGLSLLTGIVFGLIPAFRTSRVDLESALRVEGARMTTSRGHAFVRDGLVVAQVAVSLLLLVGAGLLGHSLWRLLHVDPGFDPERLLTMNVSLSTSRYPAAAQEIAFFNAALRRVSSLPGVRSAAVSNALPPMRRRMTPLLPQGQPDVPLPQRPVMTIEMVSPRWFDTMRVPLRAGRDFSEADDATSRKVVIVNDAFARRFWPGEVAIGKHITVGRLAPSEVVGVAGDVKNDGLAVDTQPQIYVPFAQLPWSSMNLVIRTTVAPRSIVNAVRREILAVDADQPVSAIATGHDLLGAARSDLRFTTVLLAGFSALALGLALLGLYAVLAYSVAQRRRELAIRAALGASAPTLMRLVFADGFALVGVGVAVGIVASAAVVRLMASVLFGVSSLDPLSFALAIAVFVTAAAASMYLPARRATRVALAEALH